MRAQELRCQAVLPRARTAYGEVARWRAARAAAVRTRCRSAGAGSRADPPAAAARVRPSATRCAARPCSGSMRRSAAARNRPACAISSERTGTAISAAAVGVGARLSAAKSISVMSVSCPTAEMSGIMLSAAARTTTSSLNAQRSSSEPPPRATMMISGLRHRMLCRQRVEAADRAGHLLGRAVALHANRPHHHTARETIAQPMQDIADDRAGRRRHHADHRRQIRQQLLARFVEQAFGGELFLSLLEQRHQRAAPGGFERFDDDLIARPVRVGRELAGDDDFQSFRRLNPHPAEHALPDHRIDLRALVLECEIDVAGGVRTLVAGDFAAHAHVTVGVLDRALERGRKLRHREFNDVDLRGLCHANLVRTTTIPDAWHRRGKPAWAAGTTWAACLAYSKLNSSGPPPAPQSHRQMRSQRSRPVRHASAPFWPCRSR